MFCLLFCTSRFNDTISLSMALSMFSPWPAGPVAMPVRSSWFMYMPLGGLRLLRRMLCGMGRPSRRSGPVVGRKPPVRLKVKIFYEISILFYFFILQTKTDAGLFDLLVIGVARGAERAFGRGMDGAAADFAVAALGAGAAFTL